MDRRQFLTLAGGSVITLTVTSCGRGESSSGDGGGESKTIAIVSKGFQHQFWQSVKKGAEKQAKKDGAKITFNGPSKETEIEAQITMLSNALAKKPDALALAALDSKAAASLLKQAKEQDIPIIAFDSGVESDIPVTTAATDNKKAAASAAQHMAKLIGSKGKVGMVVHDQTSLTGVERRDGFIDWMKKNAPGVTLLPVQYGEGDPAKSADVTKSIIGGNRDLKGIYGANEGSAIGVIKGVKESGRQGLTIVGFDSGKAQIDAIESGAMAGAITQNPLAMGAEVVKAALKAIEGDKLPKTIDTGFYWYDKKNIDDPKIKAVLYR